VAQNFLPLRRISGLFRDLSGSLRHARAVTIQRAEVSGGVLASRIDEPHIRNGLESLVASRSPDPPRSRTCTSSRWPKPRDQLHVTLFLLLERPSSAGPGIQRNDWTSRVQPDRVEVGPGARIVAELEDIPMLESGETDILAHVARRRLADARRLRCTLWYSSSTVHIHALLSRVGGRTTVSHSRSLTLRSR